MMISFKQVKVNFTTGILPAIILLVAIFFSCTNQKVKDVADKAHSATLTSESEGGDAVDSAGYYTFLIRGVNVNSKAVTDGDFIYIGDLPYSDRPDSDYDGLVYPIVKSIIDTRLFPDEPNTDVSAVENEKGRGVRRLMATLSDAWKDIDKLSVNGKEYSVNGTDFEEFLSSHDRLLNGIDSLSIKGSIATVTAWQLN